jgi:hypothetical protein
MPVQLDMIGLPILSGVIVGILAILFHVGLIRFRASHGKRKVALVSKVLLEYFHKAGVDVSVDCVKLSSTRGFTAFVESEPMKQFRLSHIIEIALRDHVQKTCAVELDKIFWRFPIKVAARAPASEGAVMADPKRIEGADDYINEGLVHYKDLPKFEATEIPWEKFEEAAIQDSQKPEEIAKVQ